MVIKEIRAFLKGDRSVNIGDSEFTMVAPSFITDLGAFDPEDMTSVCFQVYEKIEDLTKIFWGEYATTIEIVLKMNDGTEMVWDPRTVGFVV